MASTVSTPLPSLTVEGVGEVSLPLSSQQAQALAAAGEAAPYGLGAATLLDLNVRKATQVCYFLCAGRRAAPALFPSRSLYWPQKRGPTSCVTCKMIG